MNILATFTMSDHLGPAVLLAAIVIGLTVRVVLLLSQKREIFPHR
jgi:hypothetical protein